VKPKTTDLQIRGIPIATRDKLRRKAKSSGVSMSKYLIDLIDREVETMPLDEWLAMVRKNPPVDIGMSAADLLKEIHDEEDARWDEHFGLAKPGPS
jgi:post-segregation antitoxin (ccd killing protein)